MIGGETVYRVLLQGVRALAPGIARGASKLARGIRARRDALAALVRWGTGERAPDRPTAWVHAPSVGESVQLRAVLRPLLELRPELQIAFTHFSPSAEGFASRMPAAVSAYLPWDLPDEMGPALDALRPDLLVFTKTEVWPVLTREATRRGIPVVLVGATLPPGAGRLGWIARHFLRPTFERLDRVCAISRDDGDRFGLLGVAQERVEVSGDPAVDAAAQRLEDYEPHHPALRPFGNDERPTLVAGSTWPPDEEVLVPAASRIRDRGYPHLRLVIAPHEPRPSHLRALGRLLAAHRWRVRSLTEVEASGSVRDADAVVVDRVGVLALLYTVGEIAWVGGGFDDQGLHSVLEPAAAGLPVLFGPGHENARAATGLLREGGAEVVESEGAAAAALRRWLAEPRARAEAGRRSRRYVDARRGAAERTARVLDDLLGVRSDS